MGQFIDLALAQRGVEFVPLTSVAHYTGGPALKIGTCNRRHRELWGITVDAQTDNKDRIDSREAKGFSASLFKGDDLGQRLLVPPYQARQHGVEDRDDADNQQEIGQGYIASSGCSRPFPLSIDDGHHIRSGWYQLRISCPELSCTRGARGALARGFSVRRRKSRCRARGAQALRRGRSVRRSASVSTDGRCRGVRPTLEEERPPGQIAW